MHHLRSAWKSVRAFLWPTTTPIVRTYLRRLLGREHAVEAVADGRAALQRFETAAGPGYRGRDDAPPGWSETGCAPFATTRAHRRSPVVLLSARAGEEARVDGLRAGADDYLVKPFAARELLARVAAHLALQKQRRRLLDAERSARAEAEGARHSAERASSRAHSIQLVTAALRERNTLQELAKPYSRGPTSSRGDRQCCAEFTHVFYRGGADWL